MKIFKSGTYSWWQIGLLKISVLLLGIAIGANWPNVFVSSTKLLVSIAVILGVYLSMIWYRK